MDTPPSSLTHRQSRFVDEFCARGNATQAALAAGYSARSARSIAHENLTKPDIVAAIRARMEHLSLNTNEVTAHLAAQARGLAPSRIIVEVDEAGRERIGRLEFKPLEALDRIARILGMYRETPRNEEPRVLIVRSVDELDPDEFHPGPR